MIGLRFLRRIFFTTSLCLFLSSCTMVYAAGTVTADFNNQKYEARIVKVPGEHETGLREYIYEDGSTKLEEIPATGHIWSEWIVDVEPTDTREGHMYRVCARIPNRPHYEEKTIPKLVAGETSASAGTEQTNFNQGSLDTHLPSNPNISNVVTDFEEKDVSSTMEKTTNHTIANDMQNRPNNQTKDVPSHAKPKAKNAKSQAFNVMDAVFIGGTFGVSIFAYLFVLPLLNVLVWAKKKRKEILGG